MDQYNPSALQLHTAKFHIHTVADAPPAADTDDTLWVSLG